MSNTACRGLGQGLVLSFSLWPTADQEKKKRLLLCKCIEMLAGGRVCALAGGMASQSPTLCYDLVFWLDRAYIIYIYACILYILKRGGNLLWFPNGLFAFCIFFFLSLSLSLFSIHIKVLYMTRMTMMMMMMTVTMCLLFRSSKSEIKLRALLLLLSSLRSTPAPVAERPP